MEDLIPVSQDGDERRDSRGRHGMTQPEQSWLLKVMVPVNVKSDQYPRSLSIQ